MMRGRGVRRRRCGVGRSVCSPPPVGDHHQRDVDDQEAQVATEDGLGPELAGQVGRAWVLGGALVLVLPLFSGSLESEARFGLLALPVYWGLALVSRRRVVELSLRLGSLALLVTWVILLPYLWP
jgi:hypothetical protein